MQSKDLRIGNLLQDKVSKTLLEVIELNKEDITTYVIDRSKFPLKEGWGLEPIPLTEEWLIKLGFQYYKPLNHHRIVIEDRWYSINSKHYFSFVDLAGDETVCMPNTKILNVHQLQNLFHALTGQELTIKQ